MVEVIKRKSFSKELWVVVYYAIMMVITLLVMKPNKDYSNGVRFFYLLMVFLPLIKYKNYTPMVVTTFYWLSFCSFCPLLPQEITYTTIAVLVLAIITSSIPKVYPLFVFFVIECLIVSLFQNDFEYSLRFWMALLLVYLLSTYVKTIDDLEKLAYGFVICSLAISIMFLLYHEQLTYRYMGMDRTMWINPNMLGASVGLGAVVSLGLLFNKKRMAWILKCMLIITLILSLIVLLLNASRGALVSTYAACMVIILLDKKIKKIYKVLIVLVGLGIIIYMFNNAYMELLTRRIEDDESLETGGLRFIIWQKKLDAFTSSGLLDFIFGVGQTKCVTIGWEHRTHNDFVSALISYGVVGFLMFCILYFYPIFHKMNYRKTITLLPYFIFLLSESMVLEPLLRGYMFFFAFFMFINKYAQFLEKRKI